MKIIKQYYFKSKNLENNLSKTTVMEYDIGVIHILRIGFSDAKYESASEKLLRVVGNKFLYKEEFAIKIDSLINIVSEL